MIEEAWEWFYIGTVYLSRAACVNHVCPQQLSWEPHLIIYDAGWAGPVKIVVFP